MQDADLICTTDPELEEALGLCVEGATICEGGQQDVGRPELVHPVIPVLIQNRGVLQSMPKHLRREEAIAEYAKTSHHITCHVSS